MVLLGTFVMVNFPDALDEILRSDYSLNNSYLLISVKSRYARSGQLDAFFLVAQT